MAFAADNDTPETENGTVATLSLIIINASITGHVWLYAENLTDEPLEFGHVTIQPGEGASVGLLSLSRFDGWGIYYNVEAYCCNTISNSRCTWLTEELNAEEFASVSKQIKDYANYWGLYFNCMFFAFKVWNTVSKKFFIPLLMPIFGTIQMKIRGASSGNFEMFCPSDDNVYRQRGTGNNARLEVVSAISLKNAI